MREQGKHRSLGNESVTQEHRKLKAIGHPFMPQEQGKGNAVTLGKKSLAKHLKGSGVIYSSDAERKLDGVKYRLGDMVWAKVKSHPWWPGQLYDPALASANAMELKRDSCFLVAFFGDSTFGWFAEAELIPYEPNFPQKSRQTSAPNFVDAVEDSLDEVRKRVKLALACRCSAAEDDSEIEEKKDGLLYDRQLYDIRGGFEPAKLLSAVKQLASSPLSFSQSMLNNTAARVQSDAFRRLVSHKTLLEHKEIVVLPQRQHMKEHEFNKLESLKIKKLSEKDISKKQPSKVLSGSKSFGKQEASGRKQALEKALEGMNEMSKNKKRTKGVISKNSYTGKSQDCFGDKGVTNGTVSEMNNTQSGEHDAAGFNEDLTNKKLEKERGFQEGGCVPNQLNACPGNALSNRGTPSLVEPDASVTGHDRDQITVKIISNAVPDFENIKLAVTAEESKATIKKAKIAKVKKDQGPKSNALKKGGIADTELSQTSKNVKVVSKAKDKRFVDNVPTNTSRDIKKRKVIPIGKRGDLPVYSAATDSLPTLQTPQQADKITSSPTVPKIDGNHMQAEPFAQLETEVITSAEIPGVVLEPGRLCQEDAQQHRHVDDDAMEALVTGPLTIMRKNESDGDRKAAYSFQEGIAPNTGGKYEGNLKDSGLIEHIDILMFQEESVADASEKREKIKDFSNCDSKMKGGCVPNQLDACPGNALSDRGTPSLVEHAASVTGHDRDQITVKTISNTVPDFENIKLAVTAEESKATIKKAKIAKVKKNQGPKSNALKKVGISDTELSQTSKKVKVVMSKAKDKRFVDNVPTDTCRDIKKRKVIPIGKRGDLPVYSAATDSLPTLETPQQADKITSSPAVPKITGNHMQAEPVVQLETEVINSAEIPGVVLEPGRLCQEDAQQHRHVDDDAVEALVTGPLTIMGKNESDGDRKAACSFQEGIASNTGGKYEENLKDSGLIEQIDLLMFQEESVSEASKKREKIEDFSICDSKMKGQMEGEILETQLQAIENQTSKDSNVSPSRADCTMPNFDDSCAVQAFECGTAEKMQGGFQINAKVSASKHGQENKRPPRDNRERKQSLLSKTMLSSKKRGTEENISKGLQAKNKRIKSVASEKKAILHRDVGGEDGEKHIGLCRGDVEGTHVRSLHEGLMSVAAKRLDVNEECSSGVNRASTNFRKVIHKKAVFRADPDNSVSALSGAVSGEVSEVGNANNEVAMLLTEKIENKVIISADPTGAEPSEVEDIRIQGAGGDSISLKEFEEGSIFPQAMPTKRSRTVIIPLSSSSVSLRPAFEAVTPVHGPKEVLNRFGQRVPHAVETGEMRTSLLSRVKSQSEKRDLVISFPNGYILPSAKELMEVFMKFGELNAPLTQVDSKHGCAHVVFRHSRDAETALNSMKVNPVFENAHFWLKPCLKPREANLKGTTKLASRNVAMSEKPLMSSNRSLAESKIVADMRSRISADKDSCVHSSNNVSSLGVADKTTVSENTRCGRSESALQSSNRDTHNPFLPVSTASLQMSPIPASGGKQGKLNEIHPVLVASPSVILKAGALSLASPIAADISQPFLALLHELHDLVLSTGFVM